VGSIIATARKFLDLGEIFSINVRSYERFVEDCTDDKVYAGH
jgi:hypothetical protein